MTHITKVYKDKGGDRQVVEHGGEILLKGKLVLDTGAEINDGDDVYVVISAQPAIDDLELTASDDYTKTELQAVADKVDAILAALRAAGIIKAGA